MSHIRIPEFRFLTEKFTCILESSNQHPFLPPLVQQLVTTTLLIVSEKFPLNCIAYVSSI